MIPDMTKRSTSLELMDDPACDTNKLLRTVDQFRVTNLLFSRYRAILSRWVLEDMRADPSRERHLVDVGAGGADIPLWLVRAAQRKGLRLRVTAIDADPRVAEHARKMAEGEQGVTVVCGDAFQLLENTADADYVFCNHFLHHLPDGKISAFLALAARTARRRFVVSDLARSPWAYAGYAAFASLFLHRSFARYDGLLSIRRGFVGPELERLTQGMTRVSIRRILPGRFVIVGGV